MFNEIFKNERSVHFSLLIIADKKTHLRGFNLIGALKKLSLTLALFPIV